MVTASPTLFVAGLIEAPPWEALSEDTVTTMVGFIPNVALYVPIVGLFSVEEEATTFTSCGFAVLPSDHS
jgi:hypothetical protein